MRCTKNPRLKHRAEVDMYDKLMNVNAKHLCRLLYILLNDSRTGFHRNQGKRFLENYIEYVQYVQEDNDKEVRRHRFDDMMAECSYINYSTADNILTCQEGFAESSEKPLYIGRDCRSDLIDNIVLALLVLHYEHGYAETRIKRYCTAWAHCGYEDAVKWVEQRLDVKILGNTKQDVYDWMKETTPKKQRTTLQEQKIAWQGLEAFRAWTADNTR